jgi:hypothetical protein
MRRDGISCACVCDDRESEGLRIVPMCAWSQELALKHLLTTQWPTRSGRRPRPLDRGADCRA